MMDNFAVCSLSPFPELVWELILDSTDDSNDIQNVLSAFPELGLRLHRKKTVWLFDQVLPHLFRCFKCNEKHSFISACRQTCKRWRNITDSLLHNHPTRLPYNHVGLTRRTVPYREFSYDDWIDQGYSVELPTAEAITRFHDLLMNHTRPGDFLKTIKIFIVTRRIDKQANLDFINAAFMLLQSFGEFIWQIVFSVYVFEPEIILRCLSHLSNVRKLYLSIGFRVRPSLLSVWKSKLHSILPQLPFLDTLETDNQTRSFFTRPFIHHLKLQIKKLSINREYFCYTAGLKNLMELIIVFENNYCYDYEFESRMKRFPLLKRLTLHFPHGFEEDQTKMTTSNLFKILAQTKLEELRLYNCPVIEDCTCFYRNRNMDKFSSIKYLFLVDYEEQELNFLTAFPSLEHLDIHWSAEVCRGTKKELKRYKSTWRKLNTLTSIVRCYIYQSSDIPAAVNIWDKMSSLKLLSTADLGSTFEVKFAREYGNKPLYSFDNTTGDIADGEETSDSDNDDDDDDNLEMSDGSYCDFSFGSSDDDESTSEEHE